MDAEEIREFVDDVMGTVAGARMVGSSLSELLPWLGKKERFDAEFDRSVDLLEKHGARIVDLARGIRNMREEANG